MPENENSELNEQNEQDKHENQDRQNKQENPKAEAKEPASEDREERFQSLSHLFEDSKVFREALRTAAEAMKCSGIPQYRNVMDQSALTTFAQAMQASKLGIFDNNTAFQDAVRSLNACNQALGLARNQWQAVTGASAALSSIATALEPFGKIDTEGLLQVSRQMQDLIAPSIYIPAQNSMASGLTAMVRAMDSLPKVDTRILGESLSPLCDVSKALATAVDTTWMRDEGVWQKSVAQLAGLNLTGISKDTSVLSTLLKIEQQTAGMLASNDGVLKMTSTAAQIASIFESVRDMQEPFRHLAVPHSLVDSYGSFAIKQHREIQKAEANGDEKTVKWRLGLLDSVSQYVDRQVAWANDLIIDAQEDVDIEKTGEQLSQSKNSVVLPPVGSYLGYSKALDKPLIEEFEKAVFTRISEKGKEIVDRARIIQKRCCDAHIESIFDNLENSLQDCMELSAFTNTSIGLKPVLDALVHIFVNKKDSIYKYVPEDKCGCFVQVESLWNGNGIPEKEKEITRLQESLYDGILEVETGILWSIDKLPQAGKSESDMLLPEKYGEKTVSQCIYRALIKIGLNPLYRYQKENTLNDVLRDFLSVTYTEIKDQTRQGESAGNVDAGEIDLQICNEGLPVVMIESLRLGSVEKKDIKEHVDKLLTDYDPIGCPLSYVVMYVDVAKYDKFWEGFQSYILEDYQFPYTVIENFRNVNCLHSSMRHGKIILERDGKNVDLHFFALKIKWKYD